MVFSRSGQPRQFFLLLRGEPLFSSGVEILALAELRDCSLGQIALDYESALLGLPENIVIDLIVGRMEVMRAAVRRGLEDPLPSMQLLQHTAGRIYRAEAQGRVAVGGIHTRSAARAMVTI